MEISFSIYVIALIIAFVAGIGLGIMDVIWKERLKR